jgi:hypothetical protein
MVGDVLTSEGPRGFDRLRVYWRQSGFRLALADLITLPPGQMAALQKLTTRSFEVPSAAADDFGMDQRRFSLMTAALRTLYRITSDEGTQASPVLNEIRKLAAAMDDPRMKTVVVALDTQAQAIQQLLSPRSEYDRARQRDSVQRQALPALEDVSFWVDLRATGEGSQLKLVPVVLARLSFDEPIQAGAGDIAFQIPDSVLATLREQIRQLEAQVVDIRKQLGDQIL